MVNLKFNKKRDLASGDLILHVLFQFIYILIDILNVHAKNSSFVKINLLRNLYFRKRKPIVKNFKLR